MPAEYGARSSRTGNDRRLELDRIKNALRVIPSHDREVWLRIAMALKSALGEEGYALWKNWSRSAANYNAADVRATWRSLQRDGGVTLGTLFHIAKQNGWQQPPGLNTRAGVEWAAESERVSDLVAKELEQLNRERQKAADAAQEIWIWARPASPDHPYIHLKRIAPVDALREIDAKTVHSVLGYWPTAGGKRLVGSLIVVPITVADRVSTCELIDENGRKSSLKGRGTRTGGYWCNRPLPVDPGCRETILIGEGVATALSAAQASGYRGVAAFSVGNLQHVAEYFRNQYPDADLVILADLQKNQVKPEPKAVAAARAIGARLAIPMVDGPGGVFTCDFNDLASSHGNDVVATIINESTTVDSGFTGYTGDPGAGRGLLVDTPGDLPGDQGVTAQSDDRVPTLAEMPCYRVFRQWVDDQGQRFKPGVWHFSTKKDRKGNVLPIRIWICTPLTVDALTYDSNENNFGRLITFESRLGKRKPWAMPMELLKGDCSELRGMLLAMGVEIDPYARNLLPAYLLSVTPKRRVRCALQVGWCDEVFVLPDGAIGPDASDVAFQSGQAELHAFAVAGSQEHWQSDIAGKAPGNPLLTFGISLAFCGPLLGPCNAESGGFHLVGNSSTGKTTIVEAACSVWGGPEFRRSWRSTANGMEGAAMLSNDGLLALDEISEADPREVGAIIYALANGRGKQRATRTGSARDIARWRCVILSSGERTLETAMMEGKSTIKAGQLVRILDVPVTGEFGCFSHLHEMAGGARLSDSIKKAAADHYGWAGRAFLERLTVDSRDFSEELDRLTARPDFSAESGDGQAMRAARRFALVALAGELATEYGITGWCPGQATEAAAKVYALWLEHRNPGHQEECRLREQVADFLEVHGDSRFSDECNSEASVRDRAGYWTFSEAGNRVYLLSSAGMREATAGFDLRSALDILVKVGAIPRPGSDGKRSQATRIQGRLIRVYRIDPEKLRSGGQADSGRVTPEPF